MNRNYFLAAIIVLATNLINHVNAQTAVTIPEINTLTKIILHHDSLFWQAYNACDIDKMKTFLTDDVEFYHDKGGLTTTSNGLMAAIRKGICSNDNWRLRREALPATVHVFPLNGYGAILSGQHYFYINEKGKPEFRDGLARFTHVWQLKDNQWKMARILSYDHMPAPKE